ncbi:hypothetical protein HS7_13730 [Sulfolobales archaeon HS-7]|nr:hypothetical protein HS7_13730 [Sulfolobales archaeon HS-7]
MIGEKFEKEKKIKREVDYSVNANNAYLITGPRRTGKSVYSIQLSEGMTYARVDFEDERFSRMKANELKKVLEAVYQVKGTVQVLILDEVQNVEGWERFVSRLRDLMPVIVTGSNASLMSSEMATYLTGRHVDYLLLPFSFREFLKYHDVNVRESTRGISEVKSKLREYLNVGGFPESYRQSVKAYLGTLFDDVITKDVMVRM